MPYGSFGFGPTVPGRELEACEHTDVKRPVQRAGDVVQASFGGVGERGGRFDGVGDINLRVRGSPSVSTNSSSGINDY